MIWAVSKGIMEGDDNDKLSPEGELTARQFAAMICRANGGNSKDCWDNAWDNFKKNAESGTVEKLNADSQITRSQAMYMMYKMLKK